MYSGRGFRHFEIGDIDVLKVGDTFHLFHLVLPNHDYIAHAISKDGLNWQRVKNALFISDPPNWDDDMLWTMHVSPDPFNTGMWRMFYTGLSIREQGLVQRIGLARSHDLYTWEKDTSGQYPLEISSEHYESTLDEGRHWVSFRDPFFYHEDDKRYLLAAARVKEGPIIRRGCVAFAEETTQNTFTFKAPLFHPHRYDDVEVPTLIKMNERYYLLGSIREDVKVHYWYADNVEGPYYNFHDNVVLPQGNYAARTCIEDSAEDDAPPTVLIWNFFFRGNSTNGEHTLPPPKELFVNNDGQLRLRSFAGFNNIVTRTLHTPDLTPLSTLYNNTYAFGDTQNSSCWVGCESGFEAFLLQGSYEDFRLSGSFTMEGHGKFGFVIRTDEQGNGYYLSLDQFKGIAQLRAWSATSQPTTEQAFHYKQLQSASYIATQDPHAFSFIAYGNYLEFSVAGEVLLTLGDPSFRKGRIGFYTESAKVRIDNMTVEVLDKPELEDYPSTTNATG